MTTLSNESAPYVGILNDALVKLRRRVLGLGFGGAITWGAVAFCITIILCAWVDVAVDLPGAVRLACVAAGAALAFAVLVRLLMIVIRSQGSAALARRLDGLAGSRGQIASAVDLAGANYSTPITAGLAQLAVRRASEIVTGVPTAVAAPRKPLIPPLTVLFSVTLLVGIVAICAPRLVATQFLRFGDPFGDHPPYTVITFTVDPGNAKSLYGSALDIVATAHDGVLDRADLVLLDSNESLPMFPEGGGKWRATIANLTSPHNYIIRSGRVRSNKFNIDVITVPKLTDVKFRVTLPDYTNRPPYEGPLPQNGLAGLAGTWVEVHAMSNRPLGSGKIVVEPSRASTTAPSVALVTVTMTPVGPASSEVVGRFQIQASGKMTMNVTDIDGQPSTDMLSTSIKLLKDEKPFVRMIGPKPESFATPDADIKVEALAEDDYGVAGVSIFRGLNDSRMRGTDINVPVPYHTQVPSVLMLPLSEYDLRPGDTVQLFARAMDNDPAGGKSADSPVATIHVVSQKDMDRMMINRASFETLMSKYAAAQRRVEAADAKLEKLEKDLTKAAPDGKLTDAQRDELKKASDELAKAASDINKFANHSLPFDIDKALSPQLSELAEKVGDAAKDARQASGDPSLGVAGALDRVQKIRKELGKDRADYDSKVSEPMDYLAKVYPLIEDQAKFLDLYAREKDLDKRMKSLPQQETTDDPQAKAKMRDFEDEQRAIQTDLAKLLDDIDSHADQLPDDPKLEDLKTSAKEFAAAVRASPANYEIQTAESALQNFQPVTAESFANATSQTLSQYIARCQSTGEKGEACLQFQPKLSASLGDSVEQLLQSMGLSLNAQGSGSGGYSATRNSLANVGLYGSIPQHGEESASGGADAEHGASTDGSGSIDGTGNPGGVFGDKQHASGQADAPVPPQYKKRVGTYFQRVSDELSQ